MGRTAFAPDEAKAAARELLRGSVAAPCLPIDAHGDIDEAGLRRDIRHCIDVLGSTGLHVNGTFQHSWLLTAEQRVQVLEIAVDEVAGAVPIINRCAHPSPRQAVELARHAAGLGVGFIDLVPPDPQFVGADPDVLVRYYTAIAEQTALGILVFHTPRVGYTMSPELLAELAEIPNVCGITNSMPLDHTTKVRELVGDSVLVVDPIEDRCLVNMLELGQQVIFTGDSPMFDSAADQPMRRYIDAALAGRADEATRVFETLEPVRDLHRRWVQDRWQSSQLIPIAVIKYWTSQLGMTGGPTPSPLPSLTAEEMDELHSELVFVGLVSE